MQEQQSISTREGFHTEVSIKSVLTRPAVKRFPSRALLFSVVHVRQEKIGGFYLFFLKLNNSTKLSDCGNIKNEAAS